jgi:peptide/nickel transport system substrate-binding protein
MKRRSRSSRSRLAVTGGLGLGALLVVLIVNAFAVSAPAATSKLYANHACPVATGSGDGTFTRNFNPYSGGRVDFTRGAIYEPLVVVTPAGGGHTYPWLASKLTWKNNTTLVLTIRPGVKWSDGTALTNKDVVFSLTAGVKNGAMDQVGLTSKDREITAIHTLGKDKVFIQLTATDSTFVGSQLTNVFIVPEHIFAGHLTDIDKWTNPNPVGSGPFTQVQRFNGQDYVLGKNPHYWMAGAPHVGCLERIAATSNDAALVQIVSGQADWTHNFVPNVQNAYIAHDPAHYHAYYSTNALPIGLYFDTTKYPYSIVGFRKGVSQSIDRAKVSKLGEYGYAPPSDAVGIKFMWPSWVDKTLAKQSDALSTYNVAVAKKTFTDAGFTYKGSKLYDPKGNAVSFQIHVIAGWSDWVASLNIITQNLQDVGIDASVKLEPDWNSWYPDASSTKIVTLLWNYGGGPTPYGFFKSHFDTASNTGSGNDEGCCGDWEHFSDATGTQLLQQFRGTLDVAKQHKIANQLQSIFLQKFPFIPLFVGPQWSTYSTKFFVGWPTPKDSYAQPIYTNYPDSVVILTRVRPASGT